jgi:hypothetical protein
MLQPKESKYDVALREVVSGIQVLIYRRETTPIRDRDEVHIDVERRLGEIRKYATNGKRSWRKGLLELAAYCVFAAAADD